MYRMLWICDVMGSMASKYNIRFVVLCIGSVE
jgi:hypothetical protein